MACGRPADVPDLAVPELDEVLDREPRTGVLVERDPVHAAAVFGGDGDDRHAELDAVEGVERLALRGDEHDGLDVLPDEQFGRGAQARRRRVSSMLAVMTAYRASRAASLKCSAVLEGPKSGGPVTISPRVRERRVTRARAAGDGT